MKAQATGLYPFVSAGADFETALAFFAELGFETLWKHDGLAGLRYGAAFFFLQAIEVPDWRRTRYSLSRSMISTATGRRSKQRDLERRFAGVRLKAPTEFPWGREVNIVDPAGVCWHIRQTRKR
jgi:catechol 2,3-dioxygenase-like lactoylglutathione lyase family enzyme